MSLSWETRRFGDDFALLAEQQGIAIGFSSVRVTDSGLVKAEVEIESTRAEAPGALAGPVWATLNQAGADTERLVKQLSARANGLDWADTLASAWRMAIGIIRTPRPTVRLSEIALPEQAGYHFEPLAPAGLTSVIMAYRGSGKSYLLSALAVSTASGLALPCGWKPAAQGPVLYLDWESEERWQAYRAIKVANGLRLPGIPPELHYLRLSGPLARHAARIRREVDRLGVVLVLVDSLGWAAGGDLNATQPAIEAMDGIGTLPATRICAAHYTKAAFRDDARATIYGNAYFENGARAIWELRRGEGAAAFNLALYNTKMSEDEQRPEPLAVRLAFDRDRNAVEFLAAEVEDDPDLEARLPMARRLRALLGRKIAPVTADELAEELSESGPKVSAKVVSVALGRLLRDGKAQHFGSGGGRGKRQLWLPGQTGNSNTPIDKTMLGFPFRGGNPETPTETTTNPNMLGFSGEEADERYPF